MGPSFPLARSSSPSLSPLLGSTMADRRLSLTSAPSLPDLPLSTLTSVLTSLFLPHPPATDLGSARASPRHRRRHRAAGPGACAEEVERLRVCERRLPGSRRCVPSIPLGGRGKPDRTQIRSHSGQEVGLGGRWRLPGIVERGRRRRVGGAFLALDWPLAGWNAAAAPAPGGPAVVARPPRESPEAIQSHVGG
nr:uncharacterized protein LOC106834314 [Equus asinus]